VASFLCRCTVNLKHLYKQLICIKRAMSSRTRLQHDDSRGKMSKQPSLSSQSQHCMCLVMDIEFKICQCCLENDFLCSELLWSLTVQPRSQQVLCRDLVTLYWMRAQMVVLSGNLCHLFLTPTDQKILCLWTCTGTTVLNYPHC
jgi:hypothetical protein